jgi:FixJ family two-component response regulator
VRIVLSGYTDLKAVTSAVNRGELFRFLTKPWDDAELLETVRDAFRYYEAKHSPSVYSAAPPEPT